MRALPERDRPRLTALGERLARRLPRAVFRTGNAPGSDEAFAAGVARVDERRLQYVLPHTDHRGGTAHPRARRLALDELPDDAVRALETATAAASPEHARLLERARRYPELAIRAGYLLRDTLKVAGAPERGFPPATGGVFYAHARDPLQGGTGHTLRVCRAAGLPAYIQRDWLPWLGFQEEGLLPFFANG